MSKFMNPALSGLETYTPGEQPQDMKYIKLNTNESPYPPSPQVLAAVNAQEAADLRLYSDPESRALKQALAARYGVEPENVFLSNGSDEILSFAFMSFFDKGVAFADITYGFYKVYSLIYRSCSWNSVELSLKELWKS